MNSDTWLSYVDSLPWQKHHLDAASWNTFLRAGSLDIDADTAIQQVAQRISEAGDHPKEGKLQRQLRRAYEYAGNRAGQAQSFHVPKRPKPVYHPDKLERLAARLDHAVTPEWLAKASPVSTWNRSPAGFLHRLYRTGENIVVFDVFESQGCEVWVHPGAVGNLASLNYLQTGRQGVWFLANPVDGQFHWNPREGKPSRRSEEAVTSWRYWVVESDAAPKDLWLRALAQLPLPIAAIYDSGGDSIHALVDVGAESKLEWDQIVRTKLGPLIVPIGADYGAMTGVRLTRLPNCRRGQTGNMQSLLYLNPNPDYTPIAHRRSHVA